jgi:hypothetical protein
MLVVAVVVQILYYLLADLAVVVLVVIDPPMKVQVLLEHPILAVAVAEVRVVVRMVVRAQEVVQVSSLFLFLRHNQV